jgi:hypothetical protein
VGLGLLVLAREAVDSIFDPVHQVFQAGDVVDPNYGA